MSARDELHESMCSCSWRSYPPPGECDSTNQLIDAFAHELAEKIRDLYGRNAYVNEFADLIDPEVANERA